ncbi:small subunit processome component 20 homolog isoform X2 [Babesia ovis]|uniref:Small subunit processome component 20 homolog isoform X2 n=1 Tax=Babesia ovis TaxID=5869 RepID=A0A9W5T988_BABOV|nr:small subunit processome component 20 homolog isoform X2 [Babesia ovis]
MTNRGKFKFESASKRSRTLAASSFSDISTVVQTAAPIQDRRFFLHNVRNTLRCKDLLKHKQELKGILDKCGVLTDGNFSAAYPFPKWSEYVIDSLLRCAHAASTRELTPICRLLAIFFKDYGDQTCVNVPFVGLLEILEANPENNAEAVFSFLSTHFRVNSRCVSDDLGDLILRFTPWLSHKHALIRRLSMESLSLLLRRVTDGHLRAIICSLLCMDGSEHLLFGIIKNVNGTFTTKIHTLFKHLLTTLAFETFEAPKDLDARRRIAASIRRCLLMMSRHCKGSKLDLDWLVPMYEDFVSRCDNDAISAETVAAYSITAELSLEILILFQNNYRIKIKDLALLSSAPCFDAFLSHFVIPLLQFAKDVGTQGDTLFSEICQLFVRVVRSASVATDVLRDRFTDVLDDLLCFMDNATNINPLMVLFEWRLKSDDLIHISHFLLVISRMFERRELFHPVVVNPSVTKRIMDCIRISLQDIIKVRQASGSLSEYDSDSSYNHSMSIIFGCLTGLRSISLLRSKMNSVPVETDTEMLQSVLKECLENLKSGTNNHLAIDIYLLCCNMISPHDNTIWIQSLVEVTKFNIVLQGNYRVVEVFADHFSESMSSLFNSILALLPNAGPKFRCACLKFFMAYLSNKGTDVVCLATLLEMESLEPSLENERRKSILMSKAVENLNVPTNLTEDSELLIFMVFKILLSQLYVKFAPLWQSAYESQDKLLTKLSTALTGKSSSSLNSLLDGMWDRCFQLLEPNKLDSTIETDTLPSYILPFLCRDEYESTDAVTLQREVLKVMTSIISRMNSKEKRLISMCSYACDQMLDESRDVFRKNALATLSTLLQKYKLREIPQMIIDASFRDGIRSSDGSIRESCLRIIATKYPGINMKRLQDLANGDHNAVLLDDSSSSSKMKDSKMRELSLGIEIRMLCPRILQHSKQLHAKNIFEYLSSLDSRYLSLLCAELLPQCFTSIVLTSDDITDEHFKWMVEVMGFNHGSCSNFPIQRAVRTLGVMASRLKKLLYKQAARLFNCCIRILLECAKSVDTVENALELYMADCNVDSLVSITIALMIELIDNFGDLLPQFMAIMSGNGTCIEILLRHNRDLLSLIGCLTTNTDCIQQLCTSVIPGVFPVIFQRSPTPQLLSIIENIYCQYGSSLQPDSASYDVMTKFLVSQSSAVLECIKDYKPVGIQIIKAILLLPVYDSHRHLCLSILLRNLPDVKRFSLRKSTNEARNYDHLRSLRRHLESLKLCVPLLTNKDLSTINTIWNFVNDCLSYVSDLECRRLSCALLSSLPVQDSTLITLCDHLIAMNSSTSNGMDDKMDLDTNCDHLSLLIEDVIDKDPCAKVLFTALSHALFVLLYGHKDPTVRRNVFDFTQAVMRCISRSFESISMEECIIDLDITSPCEYMDTSGTPYVALLFKGLFPFVQRCLSGTNASGSLFLGSIGFLQQFSVCFSADARLPSFFGDRLHGDLLCNDDIVQCLSNLHNVQKHTRNDGLKQLYLLISQDVFSPNTIYRLLVPICLQFLVQSESPKYEAFRDTSRDCLIVCGKKLPPGILLKILRQLLGTYECGVKPALQVFSSIVSAFPVSADTGCSVLASNEDGNNENYRWLLQKLRHMLFKSEDGTDIPCIETYEAMGSLLRHQSADIRAKEVIKHSRLLSKSLCSRSREIRRPGRLSLIKFLQCMGFSYFSLVMKELSANMTRGFQLQVLVFTCHSILSTFTQADQSITIYPDDGVDTLLHMLTTEMLLQHEKEGIISKLEEARQSKAASIIGLLCEFGTFEVCLAVIHYLWSILKGTCATPPDTCFDYTNKLLHVVDNLMSSSVIGFMANKKVELCRLANFLFYGYLPLVRGMSQRMKAQLPDHIQAQYVRIRDVAIVSLKLDSSTIGGKTSKEHPINHRLIDAQRTKEEHYTLLPGASTGRALNTSKKLGFDDHIVSPLFVNVALRLYTHIASVPESVFSKSVLNDTDSSILGFTDLSASEVPSLTTAFGIVLCFLSEDLKLQRSATSCLVHLCNDNVAFMDTCGTVVAEKLVERLGSMHLVGSEDLAKDHIRLASHFLRSQSNNILFTAWKKSGKTNELISGLLMQLEANLDRAGLQTSLLKLFGLLLQLEINTSSVEKTVYEVFQEIFVRMLKGAFTPAAMGASSKVVAQFLISVPMEESNRSKRFGMLLKHVTSSMPLVRLSVLRSLHHLLEGLAKKGSWKRYSEMVIVCIAMNLLSESDLQCKRAMATLISFIWSESPPKLRKELLDCVAHFLGKSSGCKEAAFAYFLFNCLSTETSISWIRKSRIFEITLPFMQVLDNPSCITPGNVIWQSPYYLLRLFLHLLEMPKQPDSLTIVELLSPNDDPVIVVFNKVWRFAVQEGIDSNHPWIRAASLRLLAQVLSSPADYDRVYTSCNGDIYSLARPCLKLLSTETGMVERHEKVAVALKQCLNIMVDNMFGHVSKTDKNLERVVSKICYDLRLCLGKARSCKQRIEILLSLLHHYASNARAFEIDLRAPMLRVMIASSRALNCNMHLHSESGPEIASEESLERMPTVSDYAYQIISTIESRFRQLDKNNDYLTLLSFARDFVSRRKMLQRTKRQSSRPVAHKSAKRVRKRRLS